MILLDNTYDNSEVVMLESDEEIDALFDMLAENGIIFTEDGIILEGWDSLNYEFKKYSRDHDNFDRKYRAFARDEKISGLQNLYKAGILNKISKYPYRNKRGNSSEYDRLSQKIPRRDDGIDVCNALDAIDKHLRREEHKNKNKKSVNEFCDLI